MSIFKPDENRTPTPESETTPAFDFDALEKLAEIAGVSSSDFAARIADVFVRRIEEVRVEVAQADPQGDAKCIAECAHEIASSSAQVGANRLAAACRRLEMAARDRTSDRGPAVTDFLTEIDAARVALGEAFLGAGGDSAASPRILIVEDDPTAALIASQLIENSGYVVDVVANGLAAFELIETTQVDALITDLRMPRMDGRELCERVRADDRWRDMPIFVTTGMPQRDQLGWLESLPGVVLLEKPIGFADLIRRLDEILRPTPATE